MKKKFVDTLSIESEKQGVKLWEIAQKLGIHYNTLVVWRHKGLTEEQREKVYNAMNELKKEGETNV